MQENVDNQLNLFSQELKLSLGANSFQACYKEQNLPRSKAISSSHIVNRQAVTPPSSAMHPGSECSVHLWVHILNNKKEPYRRFCSARSHIPAVLEQRMVELPPCPLVQFWGQAQTSPKLDVHPQPAPRTSALSLKGFLSTPCATPVLSLSNDVSFSVISHNPHLDPNCAGLTHSEHPFITVWALQTFGGKKCIFDSANLRNKLTKNVKAAKNTLVIHRG